MTPDISGIFWFAVFGMIAAAVAVLGGAGWLIYFVIYHVQIV